jgi:hypothetical protein
MNHSNLLSHSPSSYIKNKANEPARENYCEETPAKKEPLKKSRIYFLKTTEPNQSFQRVHSLYSGTSKDNTQTPKTNKNHHDLTNREKSLKILENLKISGWEVVGGFEGDKVGFEG